MPRDFAVRSYHAVQRHRGDGLEIFHFDFRAGENLLQHCRQFFILRQRIVKLRRHAQPSFRWRRPWGKPALRCCVRAIVFRATDPDRCLIPAMSAALMSGNGTAASVPINVIGAGWGNFQRPRTINSAPRARGRDCAASPSASRRAAMRRSRESIPARSTTRRNHPCPSS